MNFDCRFVVVWPQRQTFVRILLHSRIARLLRADVRRFLQELYARQRHHHVRNAGLTRGGAHAAASIDWKKLFPIDISTCPSTAASNPSSSSSSPSPWRPRMTPSSWHSSRPTAPSFPPAPTSTPRPPPMRQSTTACATSPRRPATKPGAAMRGPVRLWAPVRTARRVS